MSPKSEKEIQELEKNPKLVEGADYYIDPSGLFVFTGEYLLKRGYCCEKGCRHCPYKKKGK
jgi:hypothetical protein